MKIYDLVIIGMGPAGIGAGIYAARGGLDTVALDSGMPGGQIVNTELVDNYPGFRNVGGAELASKMETHARELGLDIKMENVNGVVEDGDYKLVRTGESEYRTRAVIVASGGTPRKLDVPGEKELSGRGVSYCAVCDGFFFKGKDLAVVGGGDAAVEEAVYLSKIASTVTVVHRRDELRAAESIERKAFEKDNISFRWDSVVTSINGENKVESVTVENVKTGDIGKLNCAGVFIYIGFVPNTDFVKNLVETDPTGHIIVNEKMESSVLGIYAVGDVRAGSLKQIGTSIGDGITAELNIEDFLSHF